jgi:hypothetical protein
VAASAADVAAITATAFDPMVAQLEAAALGTGELQTLIGAGVGSAVAEMAASTATAFDPFIESAQAAMAATDEWVAFQAASDAEVLASDAAAAAASTAITTGTIAAMAAMAASGNAEAAASLVAAIDSGVVALDDLATDPAWAELIAQLSSDVPGAAAAAAAAIAAIANSVPTIKIPVTVERTDGGGGGGGGEPVMPPETGGGEPYEGYEGYAGGTGGFKDFGPGTPVVLHGKEAVITPDQAQSMAGGGTSITLSPTFTVDPLMSNESRADLSHFQVEDFVRQVRNNPLFQQILRDQGLR